MEDLYAFPSRNSVIIPFETAAEFVVKEVDPTLQVVEDTLDPYSIGKELLFDSLAGSTEGVQQDRLMPPVAVVLGEKDHGKTTLVDCLTGRRTQEVGGITQRIGVAKFNYSGVGEESTAHRAETSPSPAVVGGGEYDAQFMTLLDTPGHEHFVEMRRGMTFNADLAVVVVACDEGFTDGTTNVLQHAQDAEVPLLFALTKTDLAPPDRLKEYISDKYPGSLVAAGSCVEGNGEVEPNASGGGRGRVGDISSMLATWAFDNETHGRLHGFAAACVLDAHADRSRGLLIRVLVQEGQLHDEDAFVVGCMHGVVRQMFCVFTGVRKSTARVGEVVDIMLKRQQGKLREASPPRMGEGLFVLPEKIAQDVVDVRLMALELPMYYNGDVMVQDIIEGANADPRVDGDLHGTEGGGEGDWGAGGEQSGPPELKIIVKADSSAGLESLAEVLDQHYTGIRIVHSGLGNVTKHDIEVAALYENTPIVCLNLKVTSKKVLQLAEEEGVTIEEGEILHDLVRRLWETHAACDE